MYAKLYVLGSPSLRDVRHLFAPDVRFFDMNPHMDMDNPDSAAPDDTLPMTAVHNDLSGMLMLDHGSFDQFEASTDPYENDYTSHLQLGLKHEVVDFDEEQVLDDSYVPYPRATAMQQQQQQHQQKQQSPMMLQQRAPMTMSNTPPTPAQQELLPPPLIKTLQNTAPNQFGQTNKELPRPRTSLAQQQSGENFCASQLRKLDEDNLFEHLVTTMAMPRKGSLGSLTRPMVKRLRNHFKKHPPQCPQCETSAHVSFRYFNNFKKTSLLQPRYICKHPLHPTTISKREFARPAGQIARAQCPERLHNRFGAIHDQSPHRLISDSDVDAGLHLTL